MSEDKERALFMRGFGEDHPELEIAFEIECDTLKGWAFDVIHRLRSQWPFWSRLSRAMKVGRENKWFGRPGHEAFLRGLHDEVRGVP